MGILVRDGRLGCCDSISNGADRPVGQDECLADAQRHPLRPQPDCIILNAVNVCDMREAAMRRMILQPA